MFIKRNEELLSSEMDDELVMMNLESNNYFGLNKVGKDIWEFLEEEQTLNNLCEKLTNKYDVSLEQCKEDITPFIDKLKELNIIEVS
ncbi:MAG: PqqD family peptide modification chaperone [Halarcobacter sp.]